MLRPDGNELKAYGRRGLPHTQDMAARICKHFKTFNGWFRPFYCPHISARHIFTMVNTPI